MRKGQEKPIEVTITRARIQVRSVRSRLESDDVGFIRVTQFNDDLSTQAKPKGFVIDLRNNPGGLLDQAISVSDAFLEKGEIVSTAVARRGDAAVQCARRRPHQGQAAHRADQRRLGLGLRDRGGRAAGSPARDRHRHALVRQGLGANDHSARFRQWGVAAPLGSADAEIA